MSRVGQGVLLGGPVATRGGLGPYSKRDERQADAKRLDSRFLPEMQFRGLLSDAITYSVAISACEQQVLHLLQEMQLRGLLPDVITYSAAISAREWCQQPQQALQLLQEVQLRGLVLQRLR